MSLSQDTKKGLPPEPERNPSDLRGDRVYALFSTSGPQPLDENVEVHGLTPRDFLEGHSCEQCWHYARNNDEYEKAVLQVHGVKPRGKD